MITPTLQERRDAGALPDRLVARIATPPATTCWIWKGRPHSEGYGQVRLSGMSGQFAHRVVYESTRGPVPKDLVLDHLCRNRMCVNPSHLEPVRQRVNVMRGIGLTARNASKERCPAGHEYTLENTSIRDGKRHCRKCHRLTQQRYVARKRTALSGGAL